jgi:hypothetical protein
MNDVEFDKVLDNSIQPLYPDMADIPGKRCLMKIDSGPGRLFQEMTHKARFRGLYLFPGVPNATSVHQETDQNYGPFKSTVHRNMDAITTESYKQRKNLSLTQELIGLIVFGGVHEPTGVVCENAVESGFSKAQNKAAWEKVGAVPLTMKCLEHSKVRHDGTDKDDPNYDKYQEIQAANNYSTNQLSVMGYNGDLLKAEFKEDSIKAKETSAVTVENTRERQEALANAKTHGAKFKVTGPPSLPTKTKRWNQGLI